MAVAAYASVLSLMHVLDNVLHPSRCRFLANRSQIQTLRENLASLMDFLEVHHSKIIEKAEPLARKIPKITQEADDVIDEYVVFQIMRGYQGHHQDTDLFDLFCRIIKIVDKNINSIKQKLMKKTMVKDRKMGISSCIKPEVEDDVVDRTVGSSGDQNFTRFQRINRVIKKIYSKKQNSNMKSTVNDQKLKGPVRARPSGVDLNQKNRVVGLEKFLLEIMDKLTGNQQNLQVIPIVGMPGIGKTTLARSALDNKFIVDNFTILIWLTVSQNYSVHRILKGLLDDKIIEATANGNAYELGQALYQMLCGRKYLIVLDDVWSIQAWDDLRTFFPNNSNGSRIIVTTRLSDLANSLGPRNTYLMEFLDEESSWDLLSERAFARGDRSPELEEIGKKIARNCRGLPLSLVVIGGLLANSDMTPSYWELVSKNVGLFANSENDGNCLKILSLSYENLPIYLKPCFLCMAVFGEDSDMHASELVKTWIAQGFLKPARDKIPEEVALGYLNDLIDRNIIEIRKRGSRGNIKTCGMHDLLRDLCIRECLKEDLFRIPRTQELMIRSHENLCCFCAREGEHESMNLSVVSLAPSPSLYFVRSLVCRACRIIYPRLDRKNFVRMVDSIEGVPAWILQSTKVRYLRINHFLVPIEFAAPTSMTLLWNLQILYTFTSAYSQIPLSGIWEMPSLRHLNMGSRMLSYPTESDDFIVLENLQTLTRVMNFRCTEEVIIRIPNLKKLGLTYESRRSLEGSAEEEEEEEEEESSWSYYCLYYLSVLDKLESLSLRFIRGPFDGRYITFPNSLKKLSLFRCDFSWEVVNTAGLLPNLEVLKIFDSMTEIAWSPPEERFLRLKHLQMKSLALIFWIADEMHFPALENLVIVRLGLLQSIPSSFGYINALQSITLEGMRGSVIDSAREMIEEQRNEGNEILQLHVI